MATGTCAHLVLREEVEALGGLWPMPAHGGYHEARSSASKAYGAATRQLSLF